MIGFRDPKDAPAIEVNIGFTEGGLGDCIARTPAILWVARSNPQITFHHWVPDYYVELAEHFEAPHPNLLVRPISEYASLGNPNLPAIQSKTDDRHTSLRSHMTDHAFRTYANTDQILPEDYNYPRLRVPELPISGLTKPYVVVTTGTTAPVRGWPAEAINEVARFIQGTGRDVVWLGKTTNHMGQGSSIKAKFDKDVNYTVGLDFRNRTPLLQSARILAEAQAVVGVDNGLLHLAGCSDVPIVAGYTTVAPNTRLPYRNGLLGYNCYEVEPDANLGCRFCQTRMQFLYDFDFRGCFYNDLACVSQMTAHKFITQLKRVLK